MFLGVKWFLIMHLFFYPPLGDNDENEKLVVKVSCDLKYQIIVGSKNIFV